MPPDDRSILVKNQEVSVKPNRSSALLTKTQQEYLLDFLLDDLMCCHRSTSTHFFTLSTMKDEKNLEARNPSNLTMKLYSST